MQAPAILTDRVAEQDFTNVLQVWKRSYPQEFQNFMREVHFTKSHLHNPNGMTKDRGMMLIALMPARIDRVIANLPNEGGGYRYGPGWRKDPKLRRIFDNCFAKAVINKNTRPPQHKFGERPVDGMDKENPWFEARLRLLNAKLKRAR